MTKTEYALLDANYSSVARAKRFKVVSGGVLLTSHKTFGRYQNAWAPGTWQYIVEWED